MLQTPLECEHLATPPNLSMPATKMTQWGSQATMKASCKTGAILATTGGELHMVPTPLLETSARQAMKMASPPMNKVKSELRLPHERMACYRPKGDLTVSNHLTIRPGIYRHLRLSADRHTTHQNPHMPSRLVVLQFRRKAHPAGPAKRQLHLVQRILGIIRIRPVPIAWHIENP